VNFCSLPVKENMHLTVEPDCEQFEGRASAEPAGASAHNAYNPDATVNTNARQPGHGDFPTKPRFTRAAMPSTFIDTHPPCLAHETGRNYRRR
jgi:hypothetical protein